MFWLITLALPPVLLLLGIEGSLRLASPDRAPIDRVTLERRLRESETTEVRVVTTANLRGLIRPSEHPDLIYELKPSRSWVFQGAETRTNRHGMRGPEYAERKPPNTLRVAGLGDSVMFGWGVDQDEIYASRLERRLSTGKRTAQVLNFAVPGYNSAQELVVLREKALRFSPDLLLLNYCRNDWVAPFFVVDPNLGNVVESSLLLQNIRQRLVPGADESFFDAHQGMDKVRGALRGIGDIARREGLPVLFYQYPHPLRPGEEQIAEGLARESGFLYVDLFGPFQDHLRRRGLSGMEALSVRPGDPHPDSEAHQVIAEVLAKAIESAWPNAPAPHGGAAAPTDAGRR